MLKISHLFIYHSSRRLSRVFSYLKNGFFVKMKKIVALSLVALSYLSPAVKAGGLVFVKPLPEITTLSGSYAELRPNHFHGGWDFRTGGQVDLPVYAVADGYIARVVITPSGYGKMVMINHPGGITTVYGHLNGFLGKLDSAVRREQYRQRRYDVTVEFRPSDFPVKHGQQFAISGNTGGSAGPHLHFEVRRTADGTMMNPVIYNKVFGIQDDKSPKIFGVKIYGVPGSGEVNGVSQMRYLCNIGRATLRNGSTVRAWGNVSFAVKASDYMSGTYFSYGVRKMRLYVDGRLVSQVTLQNFLFDEKKAVNSLVDYDQLMHTKEYYVKFSKDKGNPLHFYAPLVRNGVLTVNQNRLYPIVIEVEDDFGHKNRISFNIRGERGSLSSVPMGYTSMFRAGHANAISRKSFLLRLPKDALYTDVPIYFKDMKPAPTSNLYSDIYDFGAKNVPLHSPADVSVKILSDVLPHKNQYVLAKLNDKNQVCGTVNAEYVRGYMVGKAPALCRMAVYKDDKAPTIGAEHILKLRRFPVLKLKIRDNLSGIDTYNGYIDGKWVLFEYDPKTARISCDLRKAGLAEGRNHTLRVEVVDYCKNKGVLETKIFY